MIQHLVAWVGAVWFMSLVWTRYGCVVDIVAYILTAIDHGTLNHLHGARWVVGLMLLLPFTLALSSHPFSPINTISGSLHLSLDSFLFVLPRLLSFLVEILGPICVCW